MRGTLYGVGVGPGDPELLTLKAVRVIRDCPVIAVPEYGAGDQVALDIAREYVEGKTLLHLHLPMIRDAGELARCRAEAAGQIRDHLEQGRDVAFLTLGDPTVYSTYSYIHKLVTDMGLPAEMVPGVPSFCAAAAALGVPLCEGGQPLHILPASYENAGDALELDGVRVLMKSGKKLGEVLALLEQKGLLDNAVLAERVGMKNQRLLRDLRNVEQSGYFSIVIVKEKNS